MRRTGPVLAVVAVAVFCSPAAAGAQTPDGRMLPTPIRLQADLDGTGPQVLTAQLRADATGTVVFRIDDTPVGGPVPLTRGTASSEPVTLPQGRSFTLYLEYSGDARYQPVTSVTNVDYRPEEAGETTVPPAPAAQAALAPPAPAPAASAVLAPATGAPAQAAAPPPAALPEAASAPPAPPPPAGAAAARATPERRPRLGQTGAGLAWVVGTVAVLLLGAGVEIARRRRWASP